MGWKMKLVIAFWALWIGKVAVDTVARAIEGPPQCAGEPGCLPEPDRP
jgi:hypothetical protein